MPVYQYHAVCQGQKKQGYITADTAAIGRKILRKRGLDIICFKSTESAARKSRLWSVPWLGVRRRYQAINEFTHYLAILLRSGIPLSEALGVITRQVPKQIEPVLQRLAERITEGAELASAIAKEKRYFDSTYIGIVCIGEASGRLEECLERLVKLRTRQQQLHQRIRSALVYPAMVATIGLAVVVFLMTFIIPRITWVLEQSGRSLPVSTKILVFVSDAISEYWWIGLGCVLAVGVIIRVTRQGKQIRVWFNLQTLKMPVLGVLIMKANIAQSAVMLDTMLRSGLPLDEALMIVRQSITSVLLKQEFKQMAQSLKSGRPMIDLSQGDSILPPVVAHMLTVGEQTGQLEETLQELSQVYDSEVDVACHQFVSILEPVLIVVMGCVVGFVVMSTILPILRISGSL